MIVDGAGGTSGDRADCSTRSTSGYGSYYRATRCSDRNTSHGPPNMMTATVDGTVVPGVLTVISCVGRRSRGKARD